MSESIKNLLKIKSIVTIILTLVFAAMLITSLFKTVTIPQEFVMVYTTVIAFYFGTQYQKGADKGNDQTATFQ